MPYPIDKKYTALGLILLLLCLGYACNAPEVAPKPLVLIQKNDNKVLKEIHADEKAFQLDTLFKNKVKKNGFNGCVLIAQREQVIYKKAFGFSDIKAKKLLTTNSAFQLASTSKTLTAAAILLLYKQGKLKLSDNLQHFFPHFPFPNITLSLLLSHRSGLNNYLYFAPPYCDANNCYKGKIFNNKALLQLIYTNPPPVYAPPNKKFNYCNTNYALLALVIEQVSGMSFADYMEQAIFKPLGMYNTWVYDTQKNALHSNKTIGHKGSGRVEDDGFADDVLGDKGIYSTVDDLLKWDQALYSETLLDSTILQQAFMGYSNEHQGKRNYGYGWRLIEDAKGDKIIYHNGWWHGYNTLFYRRPSDRTTIIILSNKYNPSTYQIKGVLSILDKNSGAIEL